MKEAIERLEALLEWSDRLGSDEQDEIKEIISVINNSDIEDNIILDKKLHITICEQLKTYQLYYGPISKCRKCTGYYIPGYVCSCGEDNSTKPKDNG